MARPARLFIFPALKSTTTDFTVCSTSDASNLLVGVIRTPLTCQVVFVEPSRRLRLFPVPPESRPSPARLFPINERCFRQSPEFEARTFPLTTTPVCTTLLLPSGFLFTDSTVEGRHTNVRTSISTHQKKSPIHKRRYEGRPTNRKIIEIRFYPFLGNLPYPLIKIREIMFLVPCFRFLSPYVFRFVGLK